MYAPDEIDLDHSTWAPSAALATDVGDCRAVVVTRLENQQVIRTAVALKSRLSLRRHTGAPSNNSDIHEHSRGHGALAIPRYGLANTGTGIQPKIVQPMQRIVSNLKIWQKFAVVGILAMGMVVLPATLSLKYEWAALDTARTERAGIAPASALISLIEAMQQHRGT